MGCIVTRLKWGVYASPDIHHINDGGRNMGHLFTIPLTPWLHRGICEAGMSEREMRELYGPSLAHGSKPFEDAHGTERWLWEQVQERLKLPTDWPGSKVVQRRFA